MRRMVLVFTLWPTLGSAGPLEALDPLACPVDTHVHSRSTDHAREDWCERSDGTKHGPYRSFVDAVRASEGEYVDGKKAGRWLQWYPDGTPYQEQHYERGILHGAQVVWNNGGKDQVHGSYRHGKEQGTWTWQYERGRKIVTTYVDGHKQGRDTEWDDSGELTYDGQYDRDKRVGRWIERRSFSNRARGTYCADQRCGAWEIFDEWGPVASGEYRADIREGVWTLWNGKRPKSRATYVHGKKHGPYERWDGDSGRKLLETHCSQGIPQGLRREWGEDGKLRLVEHYDEGELHGVAWRREFASTPGGPEPVTRSVYDHGMLVRGDTIADSGVMDPDGQVGRHECGEGVQDEWSLPDA